MCSDDGDNWVLREYVENNICRMINLGSAIYNWKYVVPTENFDFSSKDLKINCKNSIC